METGPIQCVYFIHAEHTNLVKVGWTADLQRRFDQLQTASPHKLRLLGVHLGPRQVERIYHDDLAPYRQRGEWFLLTREIRRFLMIGLNKHYESSGANSRFHFERCTAEGYNEDQFKWEDEATSFAGIKGSQPTVIDSVDHELFIGMLADGCEKLGDSSDESEVAQ